MDSKPERAWFPRSGYCERGCLHPHIHYVIPGGGLGPDHDRWEPCLPGFFLPVRVLSAYFRRRFLEALEKRYRQGELLLTGTLAHLRDAHAFQQYLDPWRNADWVVYAKPPFGGPRQVLEYLGRYTHRVAISNHRLVSLQDGQVTFRWKDYRHEQRPRLMTLGAAEFIRRFLLHSLPDGFQRIRFSGFLANRHRRSKLALIHELLADPVTELLPLPKDCADLLALLTGQPKDQCPFCHLGPYVSHRGVAAHSLAGLFLMSKPVTAMAIPHTSLTAGSRAWPSCARSFSVCPLLPPGPSSAPLPRPSGGVSDSVHPLRPHSLIRTICLLPSSLKHSIPIPGRRP